MQTKAINPFPFIGFKNKEALDFIIANLPASPAFDQLNDVVIASIFNPDPPEEGLAAVIMKTVLPFAYNGYVNSGLEANNKYADNQLIIVDQLVEGIKSVPVESIGDFISSMDETIASAKLTYEEQIPLFLATTSAKAEFEYWKEQMDSPGLWAGYLNTDKAINYMHLAGIVTASVQGSLLAYGLIKLPQVDVVDDVLGSTAGAIGLAAGKVVFGWVPLSC